MFAMSVLMRTNRSSPNARRIAMSRLRLLLGLFAISVLFLQGLQLAAAQVAEPASLARRLDEARPADDGFRGAYRVRGPLGGNPVIEGARPAARHPHDAEAVGKRPAHPPGSRNEHPGGVGRE
ncbi:hypothetical protein HMPREF1316_0621 [Olsenella profusa F0195]|uniref:Uncharacterized protein n=1 Tax=Olsenella profusa F0195 TaxID=1125712 RepID=U2V0J2_9ACTN|nr:hypothetical protein HMPREF1316_0621 [Olsenella profusa F0195]